MFHKMRWISLKLHHFSRRLLLASSAKLVGWKDVKHVSQNASLLCGNVRYCTNTSVGFSWESSSSAMLLRKLEAALKDDSVSEAWEVFSNYKSLHGIPQQQYLLSRMIVLLSYSSESHWLRRAYELVLVTQKEKPHLLHHDPLTKLALMLVRTQMAVPASTVIRIMLENERFPLTEDMWNTLFLHLVKTEIGAYLASEILVEICEYVVLLHGEDGRSKQKKLMCPSSMVFNLVLSACMKYGSTLKAQQIIEFMSRMRIVADANSIIVIARIFDIAGMRDELIRLQRLVDGVYSVTLNGHYQQFYDSLLNLHFKYNDIDSAAELVIDLYRRSKSIQSSGGSSMKANQLQKQSLLQIGSSNLRMGFQIVVKPEQWADNFVVDAQSYSGLVLLNSGRLVPSKQALAKLINGFVRDRRVAKLSNLIINIEKEIDKQEISLSSDVMEACIQLGWLEAAHDILDDLVSASVPVRPTIYGSLLGAYCKENMLEEAKVLLKQMSKSDLFANLFDENVNISDATAAVFSIVDARQNARTLTSVVKSDLAEMVDSESRNADLACHLVYELNSSILFFCRAKMMEDAMKTYKRMQENNVYPTVQTFSHIINGYFSLKMYREITIVWGDIKRRLEGGVLCADRDSFDCLLWSFLRGGYFERVMEIISYMVKHNMYIDKWKYKREFLMLHKDLYRNLKASQARTEAQSKRLEHVRAFRKWAGIKQKS